VRSEAATAASHLPQGKISLVATDTLSWPDRIENYRTQFPRGAFLGTEGEWMFGYWVLGYSARTRAARDADFYGAYPGDYLQRIAALFPDKQRVLHLFAGMVDTSPKGLPGDTCDIRPELAPTFVADAETLLTVPLERYDLVVADPPYSEADAKRYSTKLPVAARVMTALERTPPGAQSSGWMNGYRAIARLRGGGRQ
jgi:hypothetical protein